MDINVGPELQAHLLPKSELIIAKRVLFVCNREITPNRRGLISLARTRYMLLVALLIAHGGNSPPVRHTV